MFHTFQDRVIKEMRLAAVSTLAEANRFLARYLPSYNQRFAVPPAQPADLHRARPAQRELDRILSLHTTHVLGRDWTITHHGQLYQAQTNVRATHVLVEERIDGSMRITHHGRALAYHVIAARPVKAATVLTAHLARRQVVQRQLELRGSAPHHRRSCTLIALPREGVGSRTGT